MRAVRIRRFHMGHVFLGILFWPFGIVLLIIYCIQSSSRQKVVVVQSPASYRVNDVSLTTQRSNQVELLKPTLNSSPQTNFQANNVNLMQQQMNQLSSQKGQNRVIIKKLCEEQRLDGRYTKGVSDPRYLQLIERQKKLFADEYAIKILQNIGVYRQIVQVQFEIINQFRAC